MTISRYIMDSALLTGSSAIQGTAVPTNTKRTITSMTLYNSTAAPVVCEIYIVPSGGSASATNRKIKRTIAVDETYSCPELVNKPMNAGGAVYALGNGVSFDYAGFDQTNV